MVSRVLGFGVRYFDTAPQYGRGLSGSGLGSVLSLEPCTSFVVSTKVGRVLKPLPAEWVGAAPGSGSQDLETVFDFSRDGVLRSIDQSRRRLRLDRVDIFFIHDPDDHYDRAFQGAYKIPDELRSQGAVTESGPA